MNVDDARKFCTRKITLQQQCLAMSGRLISFLKTVFFSFLSVSPRRPVNQWLVRERESGIWLLQLSDDYSPRQFIYNFFFFFIFIYQWNYIILPDPLRVYAHNNMYVGQNVIRLKPWRQCTRSLPKVSWRPEKKYKNA